MLTVSDIEGINNYSSQISAAYAAALANGATFEEAVAASHAALAFAGNSSYSANGEQLLMVIGNSTINGTAISVGNASSNVLITSDTIRTNNLISNTITANGGVGATGQVLASNGSSTFWATLANPDIIPNANTTTTGTVRLATNTESVAGTSDVLALTPLGFANTSLAANGYTKFPGGLIIQWGWVAANATVGDVTFPVAFTTAAYSFQATANSSAANAAYIIASNTTTMNVRTKLAVAATNCTWFAIGK